MQWTLSQLVAAANKESRAKQRARAMGWTFSPVEVQYDPQFSHVVMGGRFTCVCGRVEYYRIVVDPIMLATATVGADIVLDPAAALTVGGSFSRAHLQADGFTEDQIAEIERKGTEFDRSYVPTSQPMQLPSFL